MHTFARTWHVSPETSVVQLLAKVLGTHSALQAGHEVHRFVVCDSMLMVNQRCHRDLGHFENLFAVITSELQWKGEPGHWLSA